MGDKVNQLQGLDRGISSQDRKRVTKQHRIYAVRDGAKSGTVSERQDA